MSSNLKCPSLSEYEAEDTETICENIIQELDIEDYRSSNLLNLVAAYAMKCENDGRRDEQARQCIMTLEFKNGLIPDRRLGKMK